METRANHIVVGLFTLGVVAAAFLFVFWFSHTGVGAERAAYRVLFEGSVAGLRQGSAVLFNGMRVGEVADLRLDAAGPGRVVATLAVDRAVPVRADTRVGLDYQGLTGIASVSLKGGRVDAPAVSAKAGEVPALAADPAAMQDVMQSVREVAARADAIFKRVDALLADNDQSLRNTIRNVDAFTATLSRNSERIDKILAGLESMVGPGEGGGMAAQITDAAKSVRGLADNLDRRTAELSASLSRFAGAGLREFEALAVDGRRTLAEIERAVRNLDRNPQRLIFGGGSAVPQYSGR